MIRNLLGAAASIVLCGLLVAPPALAASNANTITEAGMRAEVLVNKGISVIQKMETDPNLSRLMQKAKGIFIVPEYGKGGLILGGSAGSGTMLVHGSNGWSLPVFYDIGSFSFGAQIGASGGSIAMLLMSDQAVNDFRNQSNFSLDAAAGLSIADYSAAKQTSLTKQDVIVWSDTKGLFAGATIGVSDIVVNNDKNHAFYHSDAASVAAILDGKVQNAQAAPLQDALPR